VSLEKTSRDASGPGWIDFCLRPETSSESNVLNFAENFLQVAYRRNRRNGIKLTRGALWGHLYVHELWEEYPTNQGTGESLYCPICERVGHTASNCRWRIENRRKRD